MIKNAGGFWELKPVPGWQPTKKRRPRSHNHKEMNSANNQWAWKKTLSSTWEPQPQTTPWFQPGGTLSRASRHPHPDFWPTELGDNEWVLLEVTKLVVICYSAMKNKCKQVSNSVEMLVARLLCADPQGSREHYKRWVFLGIYPDKTLMQKDTCTSMFIAARFTIAKTWKQPKCPSTDEWIKKMWHIHTMEYYSAIKRNEIMPFAATWMQLEMIILSEVSQKEKDKYHMISLICGI